VPSGKSKSRGGPSTRHRILHAAAARFAETSYEEVKLRDIARDVGVDVAYVHRSFGSKEQLFIDAFDAVCSPEQRLAAPDLVRAFGEDVFEEAIEFRIFANSLSSHRARNALRALGQKRFIEPLAARLSDQALLRACLLAGCVTGIKVMRDVLRLQPLADMPLEQCRPLLEAIFRTCLEANRDLTRAAITPSSQDRVSRTQRTAGHRARRRSLARKTETG